MEHWYYYPILIIVGFVVGFINTVAGGGSLLSLPVLIFMGLPPTLANGTNRVAIVIQTALATAGFKSKGVSTFPFNIYLGIAAFFGSLLGAKIAVDIDEAIFNKVLATIMAAVILIIIFKPQTNLTNLQERLTGKYLWLGIIVFFFLGIYGGFINAGIGFLIILYLHYTHYMSLVRVNATKVFVVFIYTLGALAVFIFNDKVDFKIGLILAIGNAAGAWVSSRLSVKKGDGYIRTFLIVMVSIMAFKLWFF
ncbi:sulfite exporter TauE/SafE family protein [Flavobacteriaceae bacterium]|mgnify:FL=1|nr:sulfite exporter TauE/SafE family protein [Flavobacteriaceae bacterium]MDB9796268.1 sulfite exporter TauE/SafE family protein [Flavobacteriaceae bacterium]